jgi:hypothetical protein
MIRVFRAGLKEFGLLLDTYNIALLVSELQTIFSCLFRLPQYHPATNPRRKPGVASDLFLFLLPNVGAEIVNGVADRVRAELLRNMKLADLLRPSSTKIPAQKAS